MMNLTKRQIKISIILAIQMFGNGMIVSLQAPFYTSVADSKGVSPSEYGFVFAIYFLTQFIMSLIYGKFITQIGTRFLMNVGVMIAGLFCILFGTLIYIDDKTMFITMSLLIRIGEAVGASALRTAFFTIVAKEFPDNVGTALSTLQPAYPLGLIVGPAMGGVMYELGGYMAPFAILGTFLILVGLSSYSMVPNYGSDSTEKKIARSSMFSILCIPEVMLGMITIFVGTVAQGFYNTNLEPHLRQFNLSPASVGLMFVNIGVSYFISAIVTGRLLDRGVSPRTIIIVSCLMDIISFMIVGPAPFIPFKASIYSVIVALVLNGIAFGTKHISSIAGCQKEVINAGFSCSLETSGQVSGLWSAFHAFGAFSSPIGSGFLMDNLGFKISTLFVVALQVLLFILCLLLILYRIYVPLQKVTGYKDVSTDESNRSLL